MLEFTLSRVIAIVCGVILLAAVIVPVADMFDERTDINIVESTDEISNMIDSFWNSKADIMVLRGWDILPSSDCSLELNGHKLTLNCGNKEYTSLIAHPSNTFTISYNEIVKIERNGDTLAISYQ